MCLDTGHRRTISYDEVAHVMSTYTGQPVSTQPGGQGSAGHDTRFFGHPRGLATLFFTEMWERFSYYGMRALLILFMVAPTAKGGLGFDVAKSGAIYGLYTAMVYLVSLPGGWIADRILGQRRSVLYGGIIIAMGHFSMAVPGLPTFYLGLALIVVGTGLLKPNISTMVGQLYGPDDHRRDAGFSIFYMGINIGAFLSPLACGYVGQTINWHWGFGLAGIGMTLGLIQYTLGGKFLGSAGLYPVPPRDAAEAHAQKRWLWIGIVGTAAAIGLLALLSASGAVAVTPEAIANLVGLLLIVLSGGVFTWLLRAGDWTPVEKKRFIVIVVLFLASALFWSAFEQAGSTLNLFAERSTEKTIFGYSYPASWFQSINSLFIIALAPLMAWLWVRLGSKEPSSPAKFAWGLILVGLGFVVMVMAGLRAQSGAQVSALWLWLTYLLHTVGELCLSPVGLSAFTKLAPARVAGLMMGVWFLSTSIGDYLGGRMASFYESFSLPALFGAVAGFCIVLGLALAAFVRPMKKLMGGVH
jgi:POT family proton-dependent oligopeptide transporter